MVLVTSELLGQFVITLTTDYEYSYKNRENSSQQVAMSTSLKLKTCSQFFFAILNSTLNLEYFKKKYQSHSSSITEIINCKTGTYLNVQKATFHATPRQITC